ncbi:hypothetical protein SFUMM280S_11435 [Streptomyces fumanus]
MWWRGSRRYSFTMQRQVVCQPRGRHPGRPYGTEAGQRLRTGGAADGGPGAGGRSGVGAVGGLRVEVRRRPPPRALSARGGGDVTQDHLFLGAGPCLPVTGAGGEAEGADFGGAGNMRVSLPAVTRARLRPFRPLRIGFWGNEKFGTSLEGACEVPAGSITESGRASGFLWPPIASPISVSGTPSAPGGWFARAASGPGRPVEALGSPGVSGMTFFLAFEGVAGRRTDSDAGGPRSRCDVDITAAVAVRFRHRVLRGFRPYGELTAPPSDARTPPRCPGSPCRGTSRRRR